MKKLTVLILSVLLSLGMISTVFAGSLNEVLDMLQSGSQTEEAVTEETDIAEAIETADASDDPELQDLLNQLATLLGQSNTGENSEPSAVPSINQSPAPAETTETETPTAGQENTGESEEGESTGENAESESSESEGESAGQETEEPEEPGIPKDEPISTTGTLYGYQGTFDINTASTDQVALNEGEWDINDAQIIYWGGSAIQNSGNSSLVVRNSYIRGETSKETAPLEGNPGNLLVAGNIRTTLALEHSENIYLNSSVITRNWAALSTDGAAPALEEGQKELSLYAYGSEAIAMDGGYASYSDLFCNLYSFGSHFQSAEIGIISGTYGKVTIGTIEDGENRAEVSVVLSQSDKGLRSDKQLGSVIEGGRHALMIHSVNRPPYWEYEGYSQEEIPLLSASISARKSTLRTDLSLDKGVEYESQKQAYINHTKGSVILIKSTNVEMDLDDCEIIPGEGGTGYLIQTVFNNDTMFMNAVPDGQYYPGIKVTMKDMDLRGDIAHEDYQRGLDLYLTATTIEGAMNEYDCTHWNQAGAAEGFTDFCLDETYNTHHELIVVLESGSEWNVTAESHLSKLSISEDSKVKGIIYVDGVEQPNVPGAYYEGNIMVLPGEPEQETTTEPEQETTTEPETTMEATTEHEHNWVSNGGSPADCTHDGVHVWICTICGEEYLETLPALGHDWIWDFDNSVWPTCLEDGYYLYFCNNPGCDSTYTEVWPAYGHEWELIDSQPATCGSDGYNLYQCDRAYCGETYTEYIPANEDHNWVYDHTDPASCTYEGADWYCCTICGTMDYTPLSMHPYRHYEPDYGWYGDGETMGHVQVCDDCGVVFYYEPHVLGDGGYCIFCGYSGPFG